MSGHMTSRPPQSEFYIARFIIHCVCQENYCGPFNITSRVTQTELQIEVGEQVQMPGLHLGD